MKPSFRTLAATEGLDFRILNFDASPDELRRRLTARRVQGTDASDADIEVLEQQLLAQEPLTDEVVLKFLQVLENARAEEMSCSDLYARLDEFVEREVNLKDADKIMPLIHEHLDLCAECCDEHDALLAVLENTKE